MQTRDDSDRGKSAISPCIRGIRCSMSAGIRELSQSLGEFQLRKPSHSPPPSSSSSSLLVGGIVISRAEKTTRLFFTDVVSFPSPKRTDRLKTTDRHIRCVCIVRARFLTAVDRRRQRLDAINLERGVEIGRANGIIRTNKQLLPSCFCWGGGNDREWYIFYLFALV